MAFPAEHCQRYAKQADQPLVQQFQQPTDHHPDHSSFWAVAQSMQLDSVQVGSHSLEAVQQPSLLAIALQLFAHSIQPVVGQGHSCALIGAKTEFVSSSGCALPCASILGAIPYQSYRSQGSIPSQLNSVVSVKVDWPWL